MNSQPTPAGLVSFDLPILGISCNIHVTVILLLATLRSRARDRYRERDNNGRGAQQEGSRVQGHEGQSTLVMGASRPSSFPTILQSRDRGSDGYEENADGSRDSGGDTSSMGDPEFDGPGSGSRHATRAGSGKSSRQVMERRERDGRREGKWERKQ